MKPLLTFILFIFSLTSLFADEIVANSLGQKIILKDDNTWVLQEIKPVSENIKKTFRYASDAVEIWDKSLSYSIESIEDARYYNSVILHLHYKNNTDKKVIGVSVYVQILNAFGKVVFENTFDDEVALEPNEKMRNTAYWHFDDNEFIHGEPFDLMWQMAQNGTAKIQTKVLKVIFEDGTILTTKKGK